MSTITEITLEEAIARKSRRCIENAHHHIAFEQFKNFEGFVEADFHPDFLGTMTKSAHCAWQEYPERSMSVPLPPFNEEYFEWTDVLEAVLCADRKFTMIEVGAGYGRWSSRGVAAARLRGIQEVFVVLVEAEPTHIHWIHEHMAHNAISREEYRLIDVAVSDHDGSDIFYIQMPDGSPANSPGEWYGQALASGHKKTEADEQIATEYFGKPIVRLAGGWNGVEVEVRRLSSILSDYDFVDLVDMDIQGAEGPAIEEGFRELDRCVKRLHVGTHSQKVESQIRKRMTKGGWYCIWDFPCQSTVDTPFGNIAFGDGVQTWINPRFFGKFNNQTTLSRLQSWFSFSRQNACDRA
jgi:FkbM family methyltransferase